MKNLWAKIAEYWQRTRQTVNADQKTSWLRSVVYGSFVLCGMLVVDAWVACVTHYRRHRSRYRYVLDALELLVAVYASMLLWGVIAELSGKSPEVLVWPGLITTVFAVYVVGRSHNKRRSRRIRKLYQRVKMEQGESPSSADKS